MLDRYLELRYYLKQLNDKISTEKVAELMMKKDIDELKDFLRTYQLTYNELLLNKNEDDEIIVLANTFINNYNLIKYAYQYLLKTNPVYNKMEEVLSDNPGGVSIVQDIYQEETKLSDLLQRYDSESINQNISKLCEIKAVTSSYDDDPTYELTKYAHSYVEEKYFRSDVKKLRKGLKDEKNSN